MRRHEQSHKWKTYKAHNRAIQRRSILNWWLSQLKHSSSCKLLRNWQILCGIINDAFNYFDTSNQTLFLALKLYENSPWKLQTYWRIYCLYFSLTIIKRQSKNQNVICSPNIKKKIFYDWIMSRSLWYTIVWMSWFFQPDINNTMVHVFNKNTNKWTKIKTNIQIQSKWKKIMRFLSRMYLSTF